MKNIVFDLNTQCILAICETQELAHSTAELVSYLRHGNAIYGLFQIKLLSRSELFEERGSVTLLENFLGVSLSSPFVSLPTILVCQNSLG